MVHRKRLWILAVIISLTMIPFISTVDPSRFGDLEWTSFRGDPQNQGTSLSIIDNLSLKWEYKADSAIGTTVINWEYNVIFGTSNGTVYSVSIATGEINWKHNVGAAIFSTPAVDSGSVYICDNSGKVTCLNPDNGTVKWIWRSPTGMQIQSSPLVIPGENIYFGSDDSYLYSLYPNGTMAWRFEGCTGWIYTSPSYYNQMIYFGSCDGKMRAVYAYDGGFEVWNFTTQFIPSSPAIYDGEVYFGSYESKIFCLDADTGQMIWNTTMGSDVYSSPSVTNYNVVVGCNDGLLYNLDRSNGEILWTLDLGPNDLESSPVISMDKIAVTYDQGLVIVNLLNGTIHDRFLYGNSALVSPSVFEDKVFFGDEQGYVYFLEQEDPLNPDDDDDGQFDLNEELSLKRDVIYFIVAFGIILGVALFIYFKKYKHLRGAS
jgi:outer membrane protein assembly factor BamB